jgi:predicted acetyltransferase
MGVFEQYQERKAHGEHLDLNCVTFDQMKQMWWDEKHFDREIADLFDVSVYKAKDYRLGIGVKMQNMIFNDFIGSDKFKENYVRFEREMDEYYRRKYEKSTT